MGRSSRFVLSLSAWLVLALFAPLAPADAGTDFTVGQFLIEVAGSRNLAARDAAQAEASLRQTGVHLPALDLGKALTEGDVAVITGAFGLTVTTSHPDSPYGESQVHSFVASLSPLLDRAMPSGHNGTSKKNHNKRKRKKNKSPRCPD